MKSTPTIARTGTIETVRFPTLTLWLQGITLMWMIIECSVALLAAKTAHSPAMLAFGSDSLVELISAAIVLLPFISFSISNKLAARLTGLLLFALAIVVASVAIMALVLHWQPETSVLGIGITTAALIAMPILAHLKHREARRRNNAALAADAVQSATCAYLAAIALVGLILNATFQIGWFDSVAAIVAIPVLLREAQRAWRGNMCRCA